MAPITETPVQMFSCEFCESFKNTYLKNASVTLFQNSYLRDIFNLYDACTKTWDIVLTKIMTSAPGVEIRSLFDLLFVVVVRN